MLMAGELGRVTTLRFTCGVLGGVLLPALCCASTEGDPIFALVSGVAIFGFVLAGELLRALPVLRRRHGAAGCRADRHEAASAATGCSCSASGPLTRELVLTPGRFGLGRVPARLQPDATTNLVCGFCSTGCGLNVHLKDGRAVNLTPARGYPVNLGMACPKGWEALAPLRRERPRHDAAAARRARASSSRSTGTRRMRAFVGRMRGDSGQPRPGVGRLLGTGQIVTEEMALLGALAKFGMGMVHGDGNTRQCMATAVVAYKESFGFDAPPYTYADFEESDVIVLVGSQPVHRPPDHVGARLPQPAPAARSSSIDPRKTETAMAATPHLRARSRSPIWCCFTALAHLLIERGWIDRAFIDAHTTGFEELAEHVAAVHARAGVRDAPGFAQSEIEALAEAIHARASASRSGGRWGSTRATRACAPRRRSSTSRS